MEKIYLVTGAAGFLGSNVCRQLLEMGRKVRAFVLTGDRYAKFVPSGAEIIEGDLCDAQSLEKLFNVSEGVETVVIHCGSMVTVNPDFNQNLVNVNVGGTMNVIDKCLEHPECRRLVHVGSTGSIPEEPKGTPIREVESFDPEKVVGWYSKTKAMGCQKVLDAVHHGGLDAVIVHPTGIMGPNDFSKSTTTSMLLQIMEGKMPVGIRGSFNMADVRDLANGCILAADRGVRGETYILGNEELTLKELSRLLVDACGCRPIRFYLPLWLASKIAAIAEKKAARTGEKPMMTTFAVYNLARNNTYDYSKAMRELDYTTRPCSETIRDQVQWLIASGQYKSAEDHYRPAAFAGADTL